MHSESQDMDINGSSNTAFDHVDEFARFLRDAASNGHSDERPQTLKAWTDLAEAYRITQALRECNGNRSAAARLLGIGRRTLYAKMDKLGITATWRMS
jgi:DNA-binding NtrC family response regulator